MCTLPAPLHLPPLSKWAGVFSTISFILGGLTSIVSGYLGMKIATFANARTALEARKGIAPAFMCGECIILSLSPSLSHPLTRILSHSLTLSLSQSPPAPQPSALELSWASCSLA
jgi:hypothetical protein